MEIIFQSSINRSSKLFEINFTVSLNFIVVSILLKDVEKNIIYRFAENCLAFSPEPENTFAREVGILQF